ncbi:MAG: hypothetical protein ACJA0B_001840 [Alcanivorax borkumensis]|jgi:hypothetical protein
MYQSLLMAEIKEAAPSSLGAASTLRNGNNNLHVTSIIPLLNLDSS